MKRIVYRVETQLEANCDRGMKGEWVTVQWCDFSQIADLWADHLSRRGLINRVVEEELP